MSVQSKTEQAASGLRSPESVDADHEAAAACVLSLIESGIPADTVDLLVRGSLSRGIRPGAISRAIKATIQSYHQSEVIERAARSAS